MKKIIISAIIILVVITGIICFALYSKNIKLNKTSESGNTSSGSNDTSGKADDNVK